MSVRQDEGELYMLEELALGGELFSVLAKRAPLFEEMRFEEKFPEVDAGGAELEIESWGDF